MDPHMDPRAIPTPQAYADSGARVVRSLHSADPLLLALYRRDPDRVFAVLTDDSDFYVYGVHSVVHTKGIVLDDSSSNGNGGSTLTLHLWDSTDCWRRATAAAGSLAAGGGGAAASPAQQLLMRARVAAVLGNDASKAFRQRLETRRAVRLAAGGRQGFCSASQQQRPTCSPVVAAKEVLKLGTAPLDLGFFRAPPLSMPRFGSQDLHLFERVVAEYLREDAAARSGEALRLLTPTPEALPWLHPDVARRLASPTPVPAALPGLGFRGLSCLPVPEPYWSFLQPLRRAVCARLFPAASGAAGAAAAEPPGGGSAWDYDAGNSKLAALVGDGRLDGRALDGEEGLEDDEDEAVGEAAGGGPEAWWFRPGVHLPRVPVSREAPALPGVAAAGSAAEGGVAAMVAAGATLAETRAALEALWRERPGAAGAAGRKELPAGLAVWGALMLHGAEATEGAWDPAAVRELLVPAEELRQLRQLWQQRRLQQQQLWATAAAVDDEEEDGEEGGPAGGGGVVDVGSSLNDEDWKDIDAKDVS